MNGIQYALRWEFVYIFLLREVLAFKAEMPADAYIIK